MNKLLELHHDRLPTMQILPHLLWHKLNGTRIDKMSYKITKNGNTISNGFMSFEEACERMHELKDDEFCEYGTTNAVFEVVEE